MIMFVIVIGQNMSQKNMKLTLLIFLAIVTKYSEADTSLNVTEDFRTKRQVNSLPLIFPYGGTFKFIIGLGIPIKTTEEMNLGFAINLQYQYTEYTNISDLSQYYFIKTVSREQRDMELQWRKDERLVFYKAVANLLESNGMHGHDCILRAICEAAQYPVEEEGLVGEIMHILLTPDYGRTLFVKDPDWDETMSLFTDAAVAGRQMFNCPSIYSRCPEGQGFLELVSLLKDE